MNPEPKVVSDRIFSDAIYSEVSSGISRHARPLYLSTASHLVLLIWILHSPPPLFIAPSFVPAGRNGTSVTTLYWTGAADQAQASSQSKKAEHRRLTFPRDRKHETLIAKREDSVEKDQQKSQNRQDPPAAGSPYGSLPSGLYTGHEVRPALPMVSSDPAVELSDLPKGLEGNVIVEVTIDEAGNVIEKTVIQSFTPAVDSKVLAAVEKWRFRPATRDGVAIASKQDVYYHFPTPAQQQIRR